MNWNLIGSIAYTLFTFMAYGSMLTTMAKITAGKKFASHPLHGAFIVLLGLAISLGPYREYGLLFTLGAGLCSAFGWYIARSTYVEKQ